MTNEQIGEIQARLLYARQNSSHFYDLLNGINLADYYTHDVQVLLDYTLRLTRERDAAVADLEDNANCDVCKFAKTQWTEAPCNGCYHNEDSESVINNWRWRGLEKNHD